MNETETGRFLAMVIALDPKMPQPDDAGFMRKLWTRQLAEVPFTAADKAMQDYYSSSRYLEKREPISPADVVQWWNARRRPNERERTGTAIARDLPRPALDPQRIRDGIDQALTALIGTKVDDAAEQVAVRRTARSITCPHCHAPAGAACVRAARGKGHAEMHGHHPARIEAASEPITKPDSAPVSPDNSCSALHGALRADSGASGAGPTTAGRPDVPV